MNDGPALSSFAWWNARRLQYNIALVISGVLAFIAYATVASFVVPPEDFEITIFTILFQGVGYLVLIGIANICYCLGPVSEKIAKPRDLLHYRQTCYRVGFWFSVLLPFSIPGLMIVLAIFRPTDWSHSELP